MNGETEKTQGICLSIRPWSNTSHVVAFLTPNGPLNFVVKGAVRPKSAFLGQYDLNYTCELVHYTKLSSGNLHILRECSPLNRRDYLRSDPRALVLADRFRMLSQALAPTGDEAAAYYHLLEDALDYLMKGRYHPLSELIAFESTILKISGWDPEVEHHNGFIALRGERRLPVAANVLAALRSPRTVKDDKILLDATRILSVFYTFHLDSALAERRTLLKLIS